MDFHGLAGHTVRRTERCLVQTVGLVQLQREAIKLIIVFLWVAEWTEVPLHTLSSDDAVDLHAVVKVVDVVALGIRANDGNLIGLVRSDAGVNHPFPIHVIGLGVHGVFRNHELLLAAKMRPTFDRA